MTTMLAELYDALLAAGAPEEKARKAAEAVAAYESRFARIEHRLTVLSWQVGVLTAIVVAVGAPALWLLVRVAAKIGAIG